VEAVSAASVEPIYERFLIRSTAFCNFISEPRKNRRIPPFFGGFRPFLTLSSWGVYPICDPESG